MFASAIFETRKTPQSADERPNVVTRRPRKIERRLSRLRYWSWFRGKQFTTDWASDNFTLWRRVLSPLRKKSLRILEIGSWEGRSALFLLNFFPSATITCIDTFEGGHHERIDCAGKLARIEDRFDYNLAPFRSRAEKLKCLSQDGLCLLGEQQRRYDLAYIDGSHLPVDVAADSEGVWPLIDPGGVIIWDDYKLGGDLPLDQRPQGAIDALLSKHDGSYRLLWSGHQLIIEKRVR
jgi:predicted O-methyltransferase YrrM